MITAITTTPDQPYGWQTTLLVHSLIRCRQPGPIEVLTDVVDRSYPPVNRPYALATWLDKNPAIADAVLLLDADTVLRRPLVRQPQPGRAVAQLCRYADAFRSVRHLLVDVPWDLEYVMMPYVVHSSDLRRMAPRWYHWTRWIQHRPGWVQPGVEGGRSHWVSEMWGYMIAAAEAGVTHIAEESLMCSIADPDDGAHPVVHLTYWFPWFDKWRYSPWDPIERGRHPGLDFAADLVDELRDLGVGPGGAFDREWSESGWTRVP